MNPQRNLMNEFLVPLPPQMRSQSIHPHKFTHGTGGYYRDCEQTASHLAIEDGDVSEDEEIMLHIPLGLTEEDMPRWAPPTDTAQPRQSPQQHAEEPDDEQP